MKSKEKRKWQKEREEKWEGDREEKAWKKKRKEKEVNKQTYDI